MIEETAKGLQPFLRKRRKGCARSWKSGYRCRRRMRGQSYKPCPLKERFRMKVRRLTT